LRRRAYFLRAEKANALCRPPSGRQSAGAPPGVWKRLKNKKILVKRQNLDDNIYVGCLTHYPQNKNTDVEIMTPSAFIFCP
jgi:hypothetical protein